ncbi:MAG: HK97 family phage prohead protease [Ignavibacteria bacterium]|nr:HK97 family phage prohead protease [Ignavibacteria bacterium]
MKTQLELLKGVKELFECDFEVTKETQTELEFTGYASVYDVVDLQKEVVKQGAFDDFLENLKDPGQIPIRFRHTFDVGYHKELISDEHGLWIKAAIDKTIPEGAFVAGLIKEGGYSGLSIRYNRGIGYRDGDIVYLTKLNLVENSITSDPANQFALIDGIKENKELYLLWKNFMLEQLRLSGLSKKDSKEVFTCGVNGFECSIEKRLLNEVLKIWD